MTRPSAPVMRPSAPALSHPSAPVASREQIQSAMHTLKAEAAERLRELTLQQQLLHQQQSAIRGTVTNMVKRPKKWMRYLFQPPSGHLLYFSPTIVQVTPGITCTVVVLQYKKCPVGSPIFQVQASLWMSVS